jgi:hypothetical protein
MIFLLRKYVLATCWLLITTIHSVSAQEDTLVYHVIKTDSSNNIIPWYDKDPGRAYSNAIISVWNFWDRIQTDMNGLPYYMNHQVWQPGFNDKRGIGGDQLAMALSSWQLLYSYSGNERIKENMRLMADHYISHGFSPETAQWPNLPFPYNTLHYSGMYDGDMILGKGFLQPDKAGSLGLELVKLYKLLSKGPASGATELIYLDWSIKIANSLSAHIEAGDAEHSPLPFKVNAFTGKTGELRDQPRNGKVIGQSSYTTNNSGILELLLHLIELKEGDTMQYKKSFDKILNWMKKYPMQTMKWGPFFEDVPGWSDTQINAITFAQFIMNHREYFPAWKADVTKIFNWVYANLGNESWKKYGVTVINEQTAYKVPGNSHTSRQASAELQYVLLSGDSSRKTNAIRQLNWATYMVAEDGRNCYYHDENWLTDGYGDYVRHYLRSMMYAPELTPAGEDHILASTSIIQQADYAPYLNKFIQGDVYPTEHVVLFYRSFDEQGEELIRMRKEPKEIIVNGKTIPKQKQLNNIGYTWQSAGHSTDGFLRIRRNGHEVIIKD